ncbi:MAG TPA: hypothetical protein VI704_01310 [Bacteroidota bacterium]|nr:hypothetical protein [Bacteroidota bacterium]
MNRPILIWSSLVILVVTCLSCKSDDSTSPTSASVAQYAGVWTGTTGQSQPIYFRINSSGVVDSLKVTIRMSVGLGTCTAPFYKDTTVTIQGNTFAARVSYVGASFKTTVRGTLGSSSSSSGTYDGYGGSFSLICGSTFSVGTAGSIISQGTFTATKTP